ncbi:VCBS repeat-containing protein, partial [Mesorhizobium soli]|uniref:VCBS domain-containing protein n=1 Tax=Pseudaminobacter soli (ex Li et al. 2025) TaxID=1295366 RepID=UPI0024735E96
MSMEVDNLAGARAFEGGSSEAGSHASPAQTLVAQASTTSQAEAVDPVPVDAGSGAPVQQGASTPSQESTPAVAHEYAPEAGNVVHLPANVSIDNIKVDGQNLVLEQADGTQIVIKNAAANVPTFVLGEVEVPRVALLAALEASGVNVAYGPNGSMSAGGTSHSSGGNFEMPLGGIGRGFNLSDLLPPTALQFSQLDERDLYPTIAREPAPAINHAPGIELGDTGIVYESDLPNIGSNSANSTAGHIYEGSFRLSDPDGFSDLKTLTINGTTVNISALAGQSFVGASGYGTLTITGYNPATGVVTYKYELSGPTTDVPGETEHDTFTLIVSDGKSSSAPATITINIVDDVPTAHADTTDVAAGSFEAIEGDVLSNDVFGADGKDAVGGVVGVALGNTDANLDDSTTVG